MSEQSARTVYPARMVATGPDVWSVYQFNEAAADYQCIGVFSLEQDAKRFATRAKCQTHRDVFIVHESWDKISEHIFRYRLGKIAPAILALAGHVFSEFHCPR